jgi:putative transposase
MMSFMFWYKTAERKKPGRPKTSREIRELIRQMSSKNGWRLTKIHGELLKLGYVVSPSTVGKYMVRPTKPPSQTWAFLFEQPRHRYRRM